MKKFIKGVGSLFIYILIRFVLVGASIRFLFGTDGIKVNEAKEMFCFLVDLYENEGEYLTYSTSECYKFVLSKYLTILYNEPNLTLDQEITEKIHKVNNLVDFKLRNAW